MRQGGGREEEKSEGRGSHCLGAILLSLGRAGSVFIQGGHEIITQFELRETHGFMVAHAGFTQRKKKLWDALYRDRLKSVQILLSRTQPEPGRTGKKEQKQTSRNHVQHFSRSLYMQASEARPRGNAGKFARSNGVSSRQAGLSSADQLRRPLAGKT